MEFAFNEIYKLNNLIDFSCHLRLDSNGSGV